MIRESNLAGITLERAVEICVERSWIAFIAEWYLNSNKSNNAKSKMDISGIDYKSGINEDGSF